MTSRDFKRGAVNLQKSSLVGPVPLSSGVTIFIRSTIAASIQVIFGISVCGV